MKSRLSESARSISLPEGRYNDYEVSSQATSCQIRVDSLSLTSSGYTKYRATPPPAHRRLLAKKMLCLSFVGLLLIGIILVLIIFLGSPVTDVEPEPINELVLVLNTLAPENMPVVISFNGSWRTVPEFQYAQACSRFDKDISLADIFKRRFYW